MEETKLPKFNSFLRTEFTDDDRIWLTNGKTLRKTIGVLGMALPFLLLLSLYISSGFTESLESISHYYYTRVSGVFIGILSILGIFLIIYKGKEPIDLYVSLFAGLAVFFVVMFPTGNLSEICHDTSKAYCVTILSKSALRENIHYISAGVFLACLSFMSIFLFTKSKKKLRRHEAKKK
ncbi:hypothetical protein [Fluviicola sp.]|uniref:hypothetical protein n=1 Tax=Fluviicola sp. TaxID=1917219 RepID=UPI003D2B2692